MGKQQGLTSAPIPVQLVNRGKPKSEGFGVASVHAVYIAIISALLILLYSQGSLSPGKSSPGSSTDNKKMQLQEQQIKLLKKENSDLTNKLMQSTSKLTQEPSPNTSLYDFKSSKDKSLSYFDIPADLFANPLLRVWKWKTPLTPSQCNAIWDAAEEVDDYGLYSKFGAEYPTLDVSLDKLPQEMVPIFDMLLGKMYSVISKRFLTKLAIDGDEMKFTNGTLFYDVNRKPYDLELKGTPFVIKYDSNFGKQNKLR